MPKAYIIAQSAISYRRYITRSVKERISLWHLPYGGCHKGKLYFLVKQRRNRLKNPIGNLFQATASVHDNNVFAILGFLNNLEEIVSGSGKALLVFKYVRGGLAVFVDALKAHVNGHVYKEVDIGAGHLFCPLVDFHNPL